MLSGKKLWKRISDGQVRMATNVQAKMACSRGQGTTEYAILVGVQASE